MSFTASTDSLYGTHLPSSAVYTLAQLFKVTDTELSALARVGSGSACRSVFGGWVKWEMGTRDDGEDSIAVQTHGESHWDDMQILILVVCSWAPLCVR